MLLILFRCILVMYSRWHQASDRRTVKVGKTRNTVLLILLQIPVFPPHTGMGVAVPLAPLQWLEANGRENLLELKRRTGSTTLYFAFFLL